LREWKPHNLYSAVKFRALDPKIEMSICFGVLALAGPSNDPHRSSRDSKRASFDLQHWTCIGAMNCQMQSFVAYATKGRRFMEGGLQEFYRQPSSCRDRGRGFQQTGRCAADGACSL
jgi:hypothetical protein